MIFNSFEFAIFVAIAFGVYWLVLRSNIAQQNAFLLVASYVFYGWWDWRFLSLIIASTIIDYSVGLRLSRKSLQKTRILLLSTSIVFNIGMLGVFKYYNFFMDNLVSLMATLGIDLQESSLQLVLPVGISFYTFQTLSYSIDVYKKRIEPTSDFIAFAAFVSFFPQLVAGPIERASNLLPQFLKKREFTYDKAVDGMRQILWGLFKKIVIADNAAHYVNDIFSNYWNYNGSTLLLGGVFFALQIYGDFSGYSDVAIGVSRVFGFSLKRNFAFPYFSRDIAEFWRRWHISLSSWFRDYLYIPIGGSQGSRVQQARNILLIFVVSGLWHGANWTFIGWGLLNAIFIIPLILNGSNRRNVEIVALGKLFPTLKELISMMATFMLTTFAWILFRSESITHAFQYYRVLFSSSLLLSPIGDLRAANTGYHIIYLLFSIVILMSVEWIQRSEEHGLRLDSDKIHKAFRWIIYYIIVIMCIAISGVQQEFIYFQF